MSGTKSQVRHVPIADMKAMTRYLSVRATD
jgi:hypothetical protein